MPMSPPPRLTRRQALAGSAAALATASLAPRALAGTSTPGASPVASPMPSDPETTILRLLDAFLAETGTPGAMAAVTVPGQGSWRVAAGVADIATGRALSTADAVRIASITKTFTATVVLQLVDEGLLRLDDIVADQLPDLDTSDIANADIASVRHALGMTSGIFNWVENPAFTPAFAADPLMPFSPEQALDLVRGQQPYFAPGEGFHYAETNYTLLALIAEAVTGQPLHELVTQRVIEPLGLTGTVFPTAPEMPEPFAAGYLADTVTGELQDVTVQDPDVPWAAGAMISTLDDLTVWAEALASGTLLTPETQAERVTWTVLQEDPFAGYGLGLLNFFGYVGHNGGINGYSTFMAHEPERGVSIVAAANLSDNEGGGADRLFGEVVAALLG